MKTTVKAAIILVLLLLLPTNVNASSCSGQSFVTVGDSITHSVVLPSSWPADFASITGADVDNQAVNGWTTNLVLQQLVGGYPYTTQVQGKTVLILVGVNDMMALEIPPQTVALNILFISTLVRHLGGTPYVLTLTGVHFLPTNEERFALLQSRIDVVNTILRDYAKRFYLNLIETNLPNEPIYYHDTETAGGLWLHPGPLGNFLIASNVAQSLCP